MTGRVMLISNKESFLIRVLLKKIAENGFECIFVKSNITSIDMAWKNDTSIIYYLDNAEVLSTELLHYFEDKLNETCMQIAFIGEKTDAENIHRYLSEGLIWGTFVRPLDTRKFIEQLRLYSHTNNLSNFNSDDGQPRQTILIIDDDPTYIGVIREWLKSKYKVGVANSGAQALQWLGLNSCDLIILDFEMPVVSGAKVFEMLRADEDTAQIPVFFLTSKNDKDSVMQVMSLHPENYLLKTIDRVELLSKVGSFLSSREGL